MDGGCQGWGGGGETESQIREMRKFWRGMHNNVTISILNCALKNGQDGKFDVMCILQHLLFLKDGGGEGERES